MDEPFDLERFLRALGASVAERRALFSKPWKIAIRLREGTTYLLDAGAGRIEVAVEPAADAFIDTNLATLADLAEGRLDVAQPQPGQVCLLSGERQAFVELGSALGGGQSILATRAQPK